MKDTKWQHMIIRLQWQPTPAMDAAIEQFGLLGWEAAGVAIDTEEVVIVFKRRINPK